MSHRMLKPPVYFCLTLALFLAAPAKAWAQEPLPHLIKRIKCAVVLITTYNEEGKPVQQGSGFFVESNRIITNLHVLDGASQTRIKTFDGKTYDVQGIVAVNEKRDLALLEVSVPFSNVLALETEESAPRAGEEIIVVSNPLGAQWKVSRGTT